jgi:MoxR-like ATPase
MDDRLKDYCVSLVRATRDPKLAGIASLAGMIEIPASPRATLALAACARAQAFLEGRGFVTPQDVKSIAPDVLRHRLVPSYEAEADASPAMPWSRACLSMSRCPDRRGSPA